MEYSEYKTVQAPIMIGRTDRCKLKFNDASLSRH